MKPSHACNRLVERDRSSVPDLGEVEQSDVVEPLRGSILLGVRGAEGVAPLHPRLQKVRPLLKSHDGHS